jgi:hypothetical protein
MDDCSRLPYPYTLPSSLLPFPFLCVTLPTRPFPRVPKQNPSRPNCKNPGTAFVNPSNPSGIVAVAAVSYSRHPDETKRRNACVVASCHGRHHLDIHRHQSAPADLTCLASRRPGARSRFGLFTFQLKKTRIRVFGRGTHGIGTDRREGNRNEKAVYLYLPYLAESHCRLCMSTTPTHGCTLKSRRHAPCPKNRVNSADSSRNGVLDPHTLPRVHLDSLSGL